MINKKLYELKNVSWFFFFFIENFKEGIYIVEFIVYHYQDLFFRTFQCLGNYLALLIITKIRYLKFWDVWGFFMTVLTLYYIFPPSNSQTQNRVSQINNSIYVLFFLITPNKLKSVITNCRYSKYMRLHCVVSNYSTCKCI